jgi:hypothetical protein
MTTGQVTPERDIAHDLVRRSLWITPLFLALGALGWGVHGVVSVGLALGLVALNFAAGAAIITHALRISPTVLYGAVLFGYLVRLGVMTGVVLAVRTTTWFNAVPFAVALLVTHLGLLAAETRRISGSLAFPGLKPTGPVAGGEGDRR